MEARRRPTASAGPRHPLSGRRRLTRPTRPASSVRSRDVTRTAQLRHQALARPAHRPAPTGPASRRRCARRWRTTRWTPSCCTSISTAFKDGQRHLRPRGRRRRACGHVADPPDVAAARPTDIVGRHGGDEFVVVCCGIAAGRRRPAPSRRSTGDPLGEVSRASTSAPACRPGAPPRGPDGGASRRAGGGPLGRQTSTRSTTSGAAGPRSAARRSRSRPGRPPWSHAGGTGTPVRGTRWPRVRSRRPARTPSTWP